jgi:hypothetical protein
MAVGLDSTSCFGVLFQEKGLFTQNVFRCQQKPSCLSSGSDFTNSEPPTSETCLQDFELGNKLVGLKSNVELLLDVSMERVVLMGPSTLFLANTEPE